MTETSTIMKIFGGIGAVLAVSIPIFGMGQYVSDLKHDMDASKAEVAQLKGQVTQLQDILQKYQSSSASTARGLQGPKGEQGDTGPRGERGFQGEPGPVGPAGKNTGTSISLDEVAKLVREAVEALPQSTSSGVPAVSPLFDNKGCLLDSDFSNLSVVQLKEGMEVCDRDGRLLASVREVSTRGLLGVRITIPGASANWSCNPNAICQLPWIKGKKFVYERTAEDTDGAIALFRIAK